MLASREAILAFGLILPSQCLARRSRDDTHTRRRLRGRHPLCGIEVTSRIEVIWKPTACRARSADSRPEPGPITSTSRIFMPCSIAFLPASSAAICAAWGVDLREPLKPMVPAEDQAIVLPWASVMVIIVLLKVALTWAMPELIFLRSRRRGLARVAACVSFAIDQRAPGGQDPRRLKGARPARAGPREPAQAVVFFLPAIGRALPVRVRALVWVRCPRTGRLRRCRRPR